MTDGQGQRGARRTLVTGGAGFIGSHLVRLLLARGDRVVVVDDLSTGRRENLAGFDDGSGRLVCVYTDLATALREQGPAAGAFDEVYHLAAAVGVRLVIDEPISSIETNVMQTAALLRRVLADGACTRVMIASSSEVYGKADKSPFSEEDDVVYGPTSKSRWSYACSKAIDEYLSQAYFQKHGLPAVVARFFNTVGPRQVGHYGMVLPNFVAAALAGRDIEVYGDGRQTRCFCDVRDVAQALPRLLESSACHGRVFNVGSDVPVSIGALADRVISVLASRSRRVLVAYDRAYGPGFEDLKQRQPDLRRLRSAIGFEPAIGLDQTIRDVASWMTGEEVIRGAVRSPSAGSRGAVAT
ncbi:MAG: GDP-mannose 4,6-dehydratase [Phycisphaerales bacterium]|nr:GDP-mannose 4,6-dehydratase [Phycisphaerales bacterium]